MARVIEKPQEYTMKCIHCGAKIGFDKADVEINTLWPPIDYPGLDVNKMEPIITRKLICPYCQRVIFLEEGYDRVF